MIRRAVVLTVATLAAGTAFAAVLAVGDEVPDVALNMADGKDAKLSDHDGRTVVLFFYGTWTKHAGDDAAKAAGLLKGREKQALDLLGVARDVKPEDAAKFAKDHEIAFPNAADPKSELYKRFAEKGLPWIAVVDGKRKLRYSAAGVVEDDVQTALTEILGKREEPPKKDGGGAKDGGSKK
jgi:peroxiredoxin